MDDFEHAATAFDQLDIDIVERIFELGLQTEGPGFVVSHNAVFDRYVHVPSLVTC